MHCCISLICLFIILFYSITDALLADLQNSVPSVGQQLQQTSHFSSQQQQQHSKSTINYGDSTSGYGSLRCKPTLKPATEVCRTTAYIQRILIIIQIYISEISPFKYRNST